MRIDEARSNNQVRRIDDFLGAVGNLAKRGNLPSSYGDVRPLTWRTGAIDDSSVPDQ